MKKLLFLILILYGCNSYGQMRKSVNYEKNALTYFEEKIIYKDISLLRKEFLLPLHLCGISPGFLITKYMKEKYPGKYPDSILPSDYGLYIPFSILHNSLGTDTVLLSKAIQQGKKPDLSVRDGRSIFYTRFFCRREFQGRIFVVISSKRLSVGYIYNYVFELDRPGKIVGWARFVELSS